MPCGILQSMNTAPNTTHLSEQYFLFESSGQAVVGYFPWRGSVIVVKYDASRDDSLENIEFHSAVMLLSVQLARKDWNGLVHIKKTFEWVPSLAGGLAVENKLKNIVFALAIKFRNKEEARIAEIEEENNDTTSVWYQKWKKHLIAHTESQEINYEDNTQYALEA